MPTIVRTELAAGLKQTRLSSQVDPEDVAAAIVATIERPRFDVWVPRHLGALNRFVRVLPRGFGEWLLRVGGSDQLLASAAHSRLAPNTSRGPPRARRVRKSGDRGM